MKLKTLAVAALGLCLAAPVAVMAQQYDLSHLVEPGQYQVTTQMTMGGKAIPEHTATTCITEDQIKHFGQHMKQQYDTMGGQVQIKEMSVDGNRFHVLATTTGGGSVKVDGVFDDRTHEHSTATINMLGRTMVMHSTSRRVGSCSK